MGLQEPNCAQNKVQAQIKIGCPATQPNNRQEIPFPPQVHSQGFKKRRRIIVQLIGRLVRSPNTVGPTRIPFEEGSKMDPLIAAICRRESIT